MNEMQILKDFGNFSRIGWDYIDNENQKLKHYVY